MTLLSIIPTSANYSFQDGEETLSVKLDGGASRYRRDKTGSTYLVNVSWTTSYEGYMYLRSFYLGTTSSGSVPFTIPLILDKPYLTIHTANFVPGSFSMTGKNGDSFTFTAQLEVYSEGIDPNYQADYVAVYNEFGFIFNEDLFDILINVDFPEVF